MSDADYRYYMVDGNGVAETGDVMSFGHMWWHFDDWCKKGKDRAIYAMCFDPECNIKWWKYKPGASETRYKSAWCDYFTEDQLPNCVKAAYLIMGD